MLPPTKVKVGLAENQAIRINGKVFTYNGKEWEPLNDGILIKGLISNSPDLAADEGFIFESTDGRIWMYNPAPLSIIPMPNKIRINSLSFSGGKLIQKPKGTKSVVINGVDKTP